LAMVILRRCDVRPLCAAAGSLSDRCNAKEGASRRGGPAQEAPLVFEASDQH
jgi:hypothetical protein